LLDEEGLLSFVVRSLEKEVQEEFLRFTVIDNSPKYHSLVIDQNYMILDCLAPNIRLQNDHYYVTLPSLSTKI
jgi:hypothetical protein